MDDDIDRLLDEMSNKPDGEQKQQDTPGAGPESSDKQEYAEMRRERLATLAAGGQAGKYLGCTLTADKVDALTDGEVDKLYSRYEARLGAAMTKTLGQAALQLYTEVVSKVLPIPEETHSKLIAELEADPFVEHALSSVMRGVYRVFGMWLAPLTTAITTMKYCQFEHACPNNMNDESTDYYNGADARDSESDSES